MMTTEPLIWQEIGADDYNAETADGILCRVEAMDEDLWWYQVYDHNDEEVFIEDNFARAESIAKIACTHAVAKLTIGEL